MTRPTYPSPHPTQQVEGGRYSREDAAQEVYRLIMTGETRAAKEAAEVISTLDSARRSVSRKARSF